MRPVGLALVMLTASAFAAPPSDKSSPGESASTPAAPPSDKSAPSGSAVVSPHGTFRIDHEDELSAKTGRDESAFWLVSTRDSSRRVRLPEIPLHDVEDGATSATIGYPSEFAISPDERFILRSQKLYHGANAAYLYTRVRDLTYRPAARARVDRTVKRFFAQLVGGRELEQMGIIELVEWSGDGKSLVVSLRGREIAGYDVLGWKCTVDLVSGRVRLTEAQKKANAGTFSKRDPS
jgi:hypothetical protein